MVKLIFGEQNEILKRLKRRIPGVLCKLDVEKASDGSILRGMGLKKDGSNGLNGRRSLSPFVFIIAIEG